MHLIIWLHGELAEVQRMGSEQDAIAYYRQKCRALGLAIEQETVASGWRSRSDAARNDTVYLCDLASQSAVRA